ncbi:VPEID-CTERM sorting domain-containing protein [Roseobacter sp. MH60115]|uniref:VPEID-CTERM sorting domain-containing protein n=1 Tax=Roseobacter sp. MH60115 TaxID=2785324 RepID=UPI0018A2D400|nr:VPEID-CTERM sorting domain-containing protein [Roseobacter sp. MH60115]
MKKLALSIVTMVASTGAGMAADCLDPFNQQACVTSVPEISALEGTAALAVVAAIVLLAWERRRKAA